MIYLLGMSHHFQFRSTKTIREGGPLINRGPVNRFEEYLYRSVKEIEPEILCEEASEPAVDENRQSVTKLVADKLKLEHRYCDPNREERLALYAQSGVTEDEDRDKGYPMRERFWLNRARPVSNQATVLFICGADHIDTFSQLLAENGFITVILCRDLQDAWNRAAASNSDGVDDFYIYPSSKNWPSSQE